jgi:SAM-dependent methyltransferase
MEGRHVKVYLHIGLPKTGSTALQWTFDVNRELLKQNGILYPIASTPPQKGVGHQGLAEALTRSDQGPSEWKPMLRELDQAGQAVAVISSEAFSSLQDEQVTLVRSYLEGHNVTVVVYLRRQDELLHGLYCTPVFFYGETRDFATWRRETEVDTFLDYRKLLARWENAFGHGAMIVRPYEYEQLVGGSIISDFAASTGITLPPDLRQLGQRAHRNYPRSAITLIRALHRDEELQRSAPAVRRLIEIVYRDQTIDADLLSPESRGMILSEHEQANREIAHRYLGREDYRLFTDLSLPSQEQWEQRYGGRHADLIATIGDAHIQLDKLAEHGDFSGESSYQQLPYTREVSPRDHMWNTGADHYFDVGLSALRCIDTAVGAVDIEPRSILDMGCGHGRVCRMLRARYPHARITACDLDRDGVDFCVEHFGAEGVYSAERLTEVRMDRQFDLIWSGSLFTHMDRGDWRPALQVLADWLMPGGIHVFTTHGRRVAEWIRQREQTYGLTDEEQEALLQQYRLDGFAFLSSKFQPAGFSISGMPFVCGEIEAMPAIRLIGYHEAGWADHQDAVSVLKVSDAPAEASDGESLLKIDRRSLARA